MILRPVVPLLLAPLALGCGREGRAEGIASAVASAIPAPAVVTASVTASAPVTSATVVASAVVDAGVRPPSDCPESMVHIGRYCIDRWEAHLATRGASGEITALPFFARPPEDSAYLAVSEAGAYPQGYISRVEASAACKNAGKRLCSRVEWQRACQGRRGGHYPYGPRWQKDRCNMDKPHLLAAKFGASSRSWKYENFNDPSLDQEPGFLALTGAYEQCVGEDGVYDLVGNLHEWVSDTVDEELMDKLGSEDVERNDQPWRPGNGVFMGGFFSTHEQLGPGCKYITVAHEPTYHDYSTGFRCCATVPSTKR